ncbi:MAG: ATP-binding protein [Gammaproteobacteria bacterium]
MLKTSKIFYRNFVLIFFITSAASLMIPGGLVYTLLAGQASRDSGLPVIVNTWKIDHNLSLAHLWLEETRQGDPSRDFEEVRELIQESISLTNSLHVPEESFDPLFPFGKLNIHRDINEIISEIRLFEDIAEKRILVGENARAGTVLDIKLDAVFLSVINRLERVKETTISYLKLQESRLESLLYLILAATIFSIFFIILSFFIIHKNKARVGSAIAEEYRLRTAIEFRQKAIVDSMVEGLITINANGIIESFNPAAEKLFGYQSIEVIGENIKKLLPAPHYKQHDDYIKRYLDTGEGQIIRKGREVEGRHKNGKLIPIYLSISELNIDEEKYFVGITMDITRLKEAENKLRLRSEELERSNTDLEQFAYIASHDLQEPLRMITSYLQLLERKYQGKLDDQADKYIHYAVDGSKRMKELIESLLVFSRVGKLGNPLGPVDTNKVLESVMSDLGIAISDSGARIEFKQLPVVLSDSHDLYHVFLNLITNAIKYRSDSNLALNIEAIQDNDFWQFSVSDNGIGMEPQFHERIFQIFRRLHGVNEYSGTGIGLALCKKIIERHGGKIWVESEPGKGSTFFFTLRNYDSRLQI